MLAIASVVTPAYAQMVDGPPGSTGGLFGGRHALNPNRSAQSLEMNLDLSGGYDRDPNGFPLDSTLEGVTNRTGWSAGQALLSSNYRVGHIRRSLDARARGNVNYQGNTRTPLKGGGTSLNGVMRFGRRNLDQWLGSAEASYEPGWVFGAVNPTLPSDRATAALDLVPENGVIEQRWFTVSGTSSYQHYWGSRLQTNMLAGAGRVRPVGNAGLNSEWQNASITQSWAVRSGFDLTGSYRFDRSLQTDDTRTPSEGQPVFAPEPIQYQSANIGVRFGRRLSATRRLSLSLSGGATQLIPSGGSSVDGDVLHPSVAVSIELIPSRTWSVAVTGSRQVTVLSGVSASPMENSNVALNLSGTIARRLRLALTGSYMQGSTLAGTASNVTTAIGGNLSMRYGFGRRFATFATYSYYHHELESGLPTAAGIPPLYDRQSARVGFTWWLPLYGSF